MKKPIEKNKETKVLEALKKAEKNSEEYLFLHMIREPVFLFKLMFYLYKKGTIDEEQFFLKGDVLSYEEIINLNDKGEIVLSENTCSVLEEFKTVISYSEKDPLISLLLMFNPVFLNLAMKKEEDKKTFDEVGYKTVTQVKDILSEILVMNSIRADKKLSLKLEELKEREKEKEKAV